MEYVHGIQQLPMTPILAEYIRVPEFVNQEWNQKLGAIAPSIQTPWAGVLYLNYATINPSDAYPILRTIPVDDGQTKSYSLYIAATRPGFIRRCKFLYIIQLIILTFFFSLFKIHEREITFNTIPKINFEFLLNIFNALRVLQPFFQIISILFY